MSGQLNSQGVVAFFSDKVGEQLTTMNMGWPAVFGLLNVVYFGLHYIFASQTAHVGALYAAFLAMMTASGPQLWLLAFLAHLACFVGLAQSQEVLQETPLRRLSPNQLIYIV